MIANLTDLYLWVEEQKGKHPELAEEMDDLYQLCNDEIELGESRQHEISLCIEDIIQLIQKDD